MDRAAFDDLVQQAFRRIPRRFRSRIENVAIVVENEPSKEDLRTARVPAGHDLLGLYHGLPLPQRGWARYSSLPDRICIYQGPIERAAHSERELRTLVKDTLWHEIAHYFGLNEREVRQAEKRRNQPQRHRENNP